MKNNKDKKTTEQDQLRNPTTHEVLREVENESSEERVSGDRREANDSRINNNPNQQNTSDERDNTRSVAGPGGERKRQTGSGLTPKTGRTGSDLDGQTA